MPSPYGLAIQDRCVVCKLRNESFFCSLPTAVLQEFEKLKISTVFPKGAVLFVEGQTPRGIHMLCQGEVKLSTTSRDGRTLILKVAQPGEILGLSSCISGVSYDFTAEAHRPCQASFVRRQDFLRFLREHGGACLRAAEQLGTQHQGAVDVIRTIGHRHHASEKLAKFLLSQDAEGTNRLTLTLNHQEIAETIGTSRETVSRTLAEFKRANLIAVHGASISIRNRAAMQRLLAA
jgi:CRP/FNR family transcriptional regulator, cyclic AMP receptor protein